MEIIDSQIHVWEDPPPPDRPWDGDIANVRAHLGRALTYEDAIVAMDTLGIQGAALNVLPLYRRQISQGIYRYDNSFAEEAATKYPDRFCSVTRVDPADPDLEKQLAETMQRPGVVGIRVVAQRPELLQLMRDGRYERLFAAAELQQVPIWLTLQPHLDQVEQVSESHPNLTLVLDHMGLKQPPHDEMDEHPFQRLDQVLALARFSNVSVKLTAAPTLSNEKYPFNDLWPYLHRMVQAFGPERLMWGSDFTRCRGLHTYSDAIDYIRYTDELSEHDKELILGQSLRRILKWPAKVGTASASAHSGSAHGR